jgi:hypothetical protein
MKRSEKIAPAAAVISALSTLACCFPLGIAAAAGATGLGVLVEPLQPWLIGLSIALLGLGFTHCIDPEELASGAAERASRYFGFPRSWYWPRSFFRRPWLASLRTCFLRRNPQ